MESAQQVKCLRCDRLCFAVLCTCMWISFYSFIGVLEFSILTINLTIIKYRSHKSMLLMRLVLIIIIADAWFSMKIGLRTCLMNVLAVVSRAARAPPPTVPCLLLMFYAAMHQADSRFSCILNLYPLMCRRLNTHTHTHRRNPVIMLILFG